jgi:hypothetical protein
MVTARQAALDRLIPGLVLVQINRRVAHLRVLRLLAVRLRAVRPRVVLRAVLRPASLPSQQRLANSRNSLILAV